VVNVYGKVKSFRIPTAHSVYKNAAQTSTKLGNGSVTDRRTGISFNLKYAPENP
jgi:hypothetical protein